MATGGEHSRQMEQQCKGSEVECGGLSGAHWRGEEMRLDCRRDGTNCKGYWRPEKGQSQSKGQIMARF